MTDAQITALLDAHQCHQWPRRDPNTREMLYTIRCRQCGETDSSTQPIAAAHASHKHQATILAKALRATPTAARRTAGQRSGARTRTAR